MAGEDVDSENILIAPVMMTEESEGEGGTKGNDRQVNKTSSP